MTTQTLLIKDNFIQKLLLQFNSFRLFTNTTLFEFKIKIIYIETFFEPKICHFDVLSLLSSSLFCLSFYRVTL